jgi:hypothetical protein
MIRQTIYAQDQAAALFEFYLAADREQAFENFLKAIAEAAARIEADPTAACRIQDPILRSRDGAFVGSRCIAIGSPGPWRAAIPSLPMSFSIRRICELALRQTKAKRCRFS